MSYFAHRLEREKVVSIPFELRRASGRLRIVGVTEAIAREIEVRLSSQDLSSYEVRFPEGTKAGPYDLAIAVAIEAERTGKKLPEGVSFVGNLDFSGNVLPVLGAFAFSAGLPRVVMGRPESGTRFPGSVALVSAWRSAMHPRFQEAEPLCVDWQEQNDAPDATPWEDLSVWGPLLAGRHSVSIVARPGMGRTLLARRLAAMLPITGAESFEVATAASLIARYWTTPPFRAPHHTASEAGMFGNADRIGEVGLSRHGVLFVDEASELRRPIFNRLVREARQSGVMLVFGFSPCGCGWYESGKCRCSPALVAAHAARDFFRTEATVSLDTAIWGAEDLPRLTREVRKHTLAEVRERVAAVRARMVSCELSIGAATVDDSRHFWEMVQ